LACALIVYRERNFSNNKVGKTRKKVSGGCASLTQLGRVLSASGIRLSLGKRDYTRSDGFRTRRGRQMIFARHVASIAALTAFLQQRREREKKCSRARSARDTFPLTERHFLLMHPRTHKGAGAKWITSAQEL
jgi:hypothetical protein